MIKQFIKNLFCKHGARSFVRNIYGDEIIRRNYKRSMYRCADCQKIIYGDYLHPESKF